MKKIILASLAIVSVLFLTACDDATQSNGSAIQVSQEEYVPDGTEEIDIRSINGDVYVAIATPASVTTENVIKEIMDDVKGSVPAGNNLYIDIYDLSQPYKYIDQMKYKLGSPIVAVREFFDYKKNWGSEFEWSYGEKGRVTIPGSTVEAYDALP